MDSHIGPTLRQCSGPILGQWANCIRPMLDANVGPSLPPISTLALYTTTLGLAWLPILGQHQCANAVALYWANGNEQTALGLCWVPMLAHHCRQYWANIGPTLSLYTTTLGHAWLPILGQHCANAVALYWTNEQTALGQCWPIIAAIYNYIGPCLASHIGPTLRQCSGPILGQWANCIVPMLGANVGPSLLPIWANIGPILACWLGFD